MKKIFIIFLFLSSCSRSTFEQANKLYQEGKLIEAAEYFEKYYSENPHKLEAEYSAYMSGIINSNYGNCSKSSKDFEFIVKNFPKTKYYDEAIFRSVICPNYIYPKQNISYFGDSKSYGKNAIEILKFDRKSFSKIDITSKIYAGKKLINISKKYYLIKGFDIIEFDGKNSKIIIKYPLPNLWEGKMNGTEVRYEARNIEKVSVKAGVFYNCIKVIETLGNTKIINYYSPDIGRILTSSDFKGKETRIMELIKYE